MRKKKKKIDWEDWEIFLRNLSIVLGFIIVVGVGLLWYYDATTFDENKHVCYEWEAYEKVDEGEYGVNWIVSFSTERQVNNFIENNPSMKKRCEGFRVKTKCELNPHNKDCICEDWIISIPNIENKDIYGLECTKAREKNECEKGNEK